MKHKKTVQERKCMVKHELSADMSHVTMTIYKRKSVDRKNNNIDLNVTFNRKEDRQSKCEWGWTQRVLTLS